VSSIVASSDSEGLYAGATPTNLYISTNNGEIYAELKGLKDLPSRDQWHTPRYRNEANVRSIGVYPETPDREELARALPGDESSLRECLCRHADRGWLLRDGGEMRSLWRQHIQSVGNVRGGSLKMDSDWAFTPQRTCVNCGAFVTPAFARVFGDNDDRVAGCPESTSFRDLTDGESAHTGRDRTSHR